MPGRAQSTATRAPWQQSTTSPLTACLQLRAGTFAYGRVQSFRIAAKQFKPIDLGKGILITKIHACRTLGAVLLLGRGAPVSLPRGDRGPPLSPHVFCSGAVGVCGARIAEAASAATASSAEAPATGVVRLEGPGGPLALTRRIT
ncbi:hypothetical protein Efla_001926 [Eimeria flavescens]